MTTYSNGLILVVLLLLLSISSLPNITNAVSLVRYSLSGDNNQYGIPNCTYSYSFLLMDAESYITSVTSPQGQVLQPKVFPDGSRLYSISATTPIGTPTTTISIVHTQPSVPSPLVYTFTSLTCHQFPSSLSIGELVNVFQPLDSMNLFMVQFRLNRPIYSFSFNRCSGYLLTVCQLVYDPILDLFSLYMTEAQLQPIDFSSRTVQFNFTLATSSPLYNFNLVVPSFYQKDQYATIYNFQTVVFPTSSGAPVTVDFNTPFPFMALMSGSQSDGILPPIVKCNSYRARKVGGTQLDGAWYIGGAYRPTSNSSISVQVNSIGTNVTFITQANFRLVTYGPIIGSSYYINLYTTSINLDYVMFTIKTGVPTLAIVNPLTKFGFQNQEIFDIPYPYGIWTDQVYPSRTYQYKSTLIASRFQPSVDIFYIYNSYSTQKTYNTIPSVDTNPPAVQYMSIEPSGYNTFRILFNITDDISGLKSISISDVVYQANMIRYNGTAVNGFYVVDVKVGLVSSYLYPTKIRIVDFAENAKMVALNNYDDKLSKVNYVCGPSCSLTPSNITSVEFFPNDLDTSYGPASTTILFTLKAPFDVNLNPIVIIYRDLYNSVVGPRNYIEVVTYYDKNIGKFRGDFTVPQSSLNETVYYQFTADVNSISMLNFLGPSSQLRIKSSFADKMSPLVNNIIANSYQVTVNGGSTNDLIFTVTITDQWNGFSYGQINFTHSLHPVPFTFNFDTSNRVTPNNDVYEFKIPTYGPCYPYTIGVGGVKLVDKAGWVGIYPLVDDPEGKDTMYTGMDVLYPLRYSTSGITSVSVNCTIIPTDTTPPSITSITIPPPVDVTSNQRDISIQIQVSDDIGLANEPYYPVLYIMDFNHNWMTVHHSDLIVTNVKQHMYIYNFTMPYGFGEHNVTLSVYGLTDLAMNIAGYSTLDLYNASLPHVFQTLSSYQDILIESTSNIFGSGGILTIYGKRFGTDSVARIDYGNGFVTAPTISKYNQALVTISKISVPFIRIQLSNQGVQSNIVAVYPVAYSSVGGTCGSPVCSGHGTCLNGACQCVDGWSGDTCIDRVIDTKPPVLDNTTASVTLYGSLNLFGSIKMHSVREISGLDGSVVQKFEFGNWTLRNQSTDGSFNFIYSTILLNTSTQLNVTIQFFENQTSVVFAGEQLQMTPSTTKISIDLSKFNFTSVLNTLQVVMDLSVDKTQDDCIDKQYGGDSYGIQWVKLKIGGKSLYGRFIKKGIIDGRVISVSNTILDKELQLSNSTSKQTQTYIGINVPRYTNKVSLDPDISMLLEGEKDSSCTSSESKGLSVGQIVGIAVGSAMGLIFVSLITIYLIKRKYKIVLKGKEKGLIKLERTQN